MNEFLHKIFLSNYIYSYLYVFGVIIIAIIFKRWLSKYVARLLFLLIKRACNVSKTAFISLIIKPLEVFLTILISIIALEKLRFPEDVEFTIYRTSFKEVISATVTTILIISFIWLLLRIIDFIAIILEERANKTDAITDNQLIVFFKDFFKVLLIIMGILLVLRFSFNQNIGNLLTGLSIVGAAIALSTRESLENLIASFIIFFDKPFSTGDTVKVLNITGTVEKIGLRSTRIRTEQKTFVTVPNKQMVDSVLDNLSLRNQRRVDLQLAVSLSTTTTQLEDLVKNVRHTVLQQKDIQSVQVHFNDIQHNAYTIAVEYYVAAVVSNERFNVIRQHVNVAIAKQIESSNTFYAGKNIDVRLIERV